MNNKPVIIGSAEAGELRRRLERLETQVSVLIDTVEAYKGVAAALQTICDTVDGHEARLNAMAILKPVAVERETHIARKKREARSAANLSADIQRDLGQDG